MPRPRRLACALTGLFCLIIYFIPSPTKKHIYLPNGLLQVNPDASHPIYELIQINKATWANRLAHASQTLPQAIAEYKRRYGRPPPKGFDKWFHWAKSHGVQLLDDYDSVIKGLEPFWGVSPSDFKNTQARQEFTTDTFTIAKNASFNPTHLARASFSDPETWQQRALLRGLDEILALLEPVDDQLPNFRLIFSPHDNPNLLTNYEIRQAYIDAARNGSCQLRSYLLAENHLTTDQMSTSPPSHPHLQLATAQHARPVLQHAHTTPSTPPLTAPPAPHHAYTPKHSSIPTSQPWTPACTPTSSTTTANTSHTTSPHSPSNPTSPSNSPTAPPPSSTTSPRQASSPGSKTLTLAKTTSSGTKKSTKESSGGAATPA